MQQSGAKIKEIMRINTSIELLITITYFSIYLTPRFIVHVINAIFT